MSKSKIDYADWSWGVVDGCTPIKTGCQNCYARAMADRFWGERKFSEVRMHPERLDEVIKLKPQVVFVAPMGDLFHSKVTDEFIERVFIWMTVQAPQHIYLIFTKRPQRMRNFMDAHRYFAQKNIWQGVSVSTQKDVDEFLPILCDTPAGKRIVSAEPLLEAINLEIYDDNGEIVLPQLSWVATGCESGSNRRRVDKDAFRSLRDQCKFHGIPFYIKQFVCEGKIVHKPYLDGRQWLEMPGAVG